LYSNRARFNASKGFELEDDLEFCPEIQEPFLYSRHNHSSGTTATSGSSGSNFTHHRFNPYTSTSYSPQASPTLTAHSNSNNNTSPISKVAGNHHSTPNTRILASPGDKSSPKVITPRAKKVLEIVNPVTGLRVSSPASFK
jgi:hypothetical protein